MADENSRLFRRTYELVLGEPNDTGLRIEGNEEQNEGLQLQFSIKKTINNKDDQDKASISLTNLSDDSLNYVKETSSVVILKVGYGGDNKLLFQGVIQEIESDDRLSGEDRVTTFRCLPGTNASYKPTISRTFPEETTPRQVLESLVSDSESISQASFNSDYIDDPIPFGYSIEGSTSNTLKEMSRDFGFNFRIDGDKLYIADQNKYEKPNSAQKAFVFSPVTGLKGVPTYVTGDGKEVKGAKNKRKGVKFTSLINPLVRPGSAVKLEDAPLEGIYRVNSVEYKGSWRGTTWDAVHLCSKLNAKEVGG